MSNRLGGFQGTAYTGTNANQPPNWSFNDRDPNQYDTQNVSLGDLWMNTVAERVWVLVSLAGDPTSKGALADWILWSGGSGVVTQLQPDVPFAPVPPNPTGTIFITGGTGINTSGSASTNTVTISASGATAQSFPTDSGTATPAAGVLDIFGDGHNVKTTGSGHQVTVGLTGITQHSLQVGGAANALTQLGVATNGQLPIGSTGADPVLAELTAGSGIGISNAAGSITITNTQTNPAASCNFFAYRNASINNFGGGVNQIPLNAVDYDLGSNFNTGTYTFTAPNTGYYMFTYGVGCSASNDGATAFTLYLLLSTGADYLGVNNGNPYATVAGSTSIAGSSSVSIKLTAGTTVKLYMDRGSAGAGTETLLGNAAGGDYRTWLSGYQIA